MSKLSLPQRPSTSMEIAPHWAAGLEALTVVVEAAGVLAIIGGMLVAAARYVTSLLHRRGSPATLDDLRSGIGRSILLGLEILIAADIIHTVAVKTSLESLLTLAAIVAIRTFLSFALEVEMEGRWPWRGRPGPKD